MEYKPREKPLEPGYYLVGNQDDDPHLIQVCVQGDSHGMFYALLEDDGEKYPLEAWAGCLWYGPLDEHDRKSFAALLR